MATREMVNRIDFQERRLKSVYDALDCGSLKKAIHEADKVLKKDPSSHTARALKGLALFRSGHPMEAAAIVDALLAEVPTEEATLHALTFYFRENGQVNGMADLLRKACQKCPDREDLLSHLFYSDVRHQDYKAQQTTARKLYKLFPNGGDYYSWVIMSTVMQGEENPALAVKMFLPLAEKMLAKLVEDGGITTDKQLDLYLLVLEKLDKFKVARDLLNTDIVAKLTKTEQILDVNNLLCQYNEKIEDHSEVARLAKDLISNNPDDWNAWKGYLNAVAALNKTSTAGDEYSFSQVSDQITAYQKSRGHMRGPHLALMLFTILCSDTQLHPVSSEDQLTAYFDKFGHKPVSAFDLVFFLPQLIPSHENQQKWIKTIEKSTPESPFENLNALQRRLTCEQLTRYLGLHSNPSMTVAEREAVVDRLLTYYKDSLPFGADLKVTEIQPGDSFLCLAVSVLHDLYRLEASSSQTGGPQLTLLNPRLVRAVALLQAGIARSPSGHYLKLRLIRIYGLLGCYWAGFKTFETLDVKQVMWDTLGYLLTDNSTRLGQYSNALMHLQHLVKLRRSSTREVEDCTVTAYKHSAFRKAVEFATFHRRLNNSWQFAFGEAEQRTISTILTPNSFEQLIEEILELGLDPFENFDPSNLVDGRDFDVTPSFDPIELQFTSEDQKKSFEEEKKWLSFSHLIVKGILVSGKLAMLTGHDLDREVDPRDNGGADTLEAEIKKSKEIEDLADRVLIQFNAMCTEIESKEYKLPIDRSLMAPNPSLLSLHLHGCFGHVFKAGLQIMQYVRNVARDAKCRDEGLETSLFSSCISALKTASEDLWLPTEDTSPPNSAHSMANLIPRISAITEAIALLNVFFVTLDAALKPLRVTAQHGRKKGKKKRRDVDDVISHPLFSFISKAGEAAHSVSDLSRSLCTVLTRLKVFWEVDKLTDKLQLLMPPSSADATTNSSGENGEHAEAKMSLDCQHVADMVSQSYTRSLTELLGILETKTKCLSTLFDSPANHSASHETASANHKEVH